MVLLRYIIVSVFAIFVPVAAQAQNYPDRPIKLIAPFPAGEIGRAHV